MMIRALIACFTLLLAAAADPAEKPKTPKPSAKAPMLSSASMDARVYPVTPAYDAQAEAQLLELANRDRAVAGLPALKLDRGLTEAARNHAFAMAKAQKLSHQFAGEAALTQRISAVTDLHIDQAGENVALDFDVESAQDHLMNSPPHRANLLDTGFNVAGFAVVRASGRLYVVQDFARKFSTYNLHQTESMIAGALNQWRSQHSLSAVKVTAPAEIRDAACGMAQTNTLQTRTIRDLSQRHPVMTYTQAQPDVLPSGIGNLLSKPQVKQVSVGACFARGEKYPNGVYWVALSAE